VNSSHLTHLDNNLDDTIPAGGRDNEAEKPEVSPELDTRSNLLACLEALLFVAPGPVTASQLATAVNIPTPEVECGLRELEKLYSQEALLHGLRLQHFGGQLQLTTSPEIAPIIERFLGMDVNSRLSRASLETLSIVMYKQPVTRPQIDAIRGVNSDAVLKGLLLKGLVQEIGRAEAPGRPILYSITQECLQIFGLSSLADLPPLELEEKDGLER
jgi:segregation and condensation protein B